MTDDKSEAQSQAEQSAEADQEAEEKVKALEGDPPKELEDWPDDEAKYKTFGGPEGETAYEDGPTSALGDADVRHHEDGSVTVGGEKVDNPDEYKGDPIPGGPTDPNTPGISGERDLSDDEDDDAGDENQD
jgi:hypothetical protein